MFSPTHVNVTVHRAFNLRGKGKVGTNDAYVVIQLGTETYKTSVQERTMEPLWNEEYMFPLPMDSRNSDVIRVSVYHRNLLSLDDLLGLTEIPLYKIRDRDRARGRRYVLYDKLPLRSSIGKGGRIRRRGSDIPEDASTEDLSCSGRATPVTPGTPDVSPLAGQENTDSPTNRAEIELTITFTQDRPKNSHNLLRPRSSNKLQNEEKAVRRRSMPSAFNLPPAEESSSDIKRKNRHSIMSVFEAPINLLSNSMRRSSTCSVDDMSSFDPSTNDPEKAMIDNKKNVILKKEQNKDADSFNQVDAVQIRNNSKTETSNATNNVRPTAIRFSTSSPSGSAATTPASSWRSESLVTSPDTILTPDSSNFSSTEQETDEKEDELRRFQRDRKRYTRAVRKLPGFMTIDSQEKINRYQPSSDELNLFCGYNREDLISTVIRQHARLTLAEAYIGDLEHCINNLVLRAMDAQPRLLQNPYMRQQSEPVVTSSRRPAFLKTTKKVFKNKLNRNSGKENM